MKLLSLPLWVVRLVSALALGCFFLAIMALAPAPFLLPASIVLGLVAGFVMAHTEKVYAAAPASPLPPHPESGKYLLQDAIIEAVIPQPDDSLHVYVAFSKASLALEGYQGVYPIPRDQLPEELSIYVHVLPADARAVGPLLEALVGQETPGSVAIDCEFVYVYLEENQPTLLNIDLHGAVFNFEPLLFSVS